MKRVPILKSSANPEKLALTVKGILTGLIPLTVAFTASFGVEVAQDTLMQAIEAITALVAAGMTLYGVARKIYYATRGSNTAE